MNCRRWILPVLYAAGIFALSSVENIPKVSQVANWDKAAHFLLYYFFAAAIYWALVPRAAGGEAALVAAVVAAIYGVTDEFHQWFVPGRTMSFYDWAADAAGAVAWAAVMAAARKLEGK